MALCPVAPQSECHVANALLPVLRLCCRAYALLSSRPLKRKQRKREFLDRLLSFLDGGQGQASAEGIATACCPAPRAAARCCCPGDSSLVSILLDLILPSDVLVAFQVLQADKARLDQAGQFKPMRTRQTSRKLKYRQGKAITK